MAGLPWPCAGASSCLDARMRTSRGPAASSVLLACPRRDAATPSDEQTAMSHNCGENEPQTSSTRACSWQVNPQWFTPPPARPLPPLQPPATRRTGPAECPGGSLARCSGDSCWKVLRLSAAMRMSSGALVCCTAHCGWKAGVRGTGRLKRADGASRRSGAGKAGRVKARVASTRPGPP